MIAFNILIYIIALLNSNGILLWLLFVILSLFTIMIVSSDLMWYSLLKPFEFKYYKYLTSMMLTILILFLNFYGIQLVCDNDFFHMVSSFLDTIDTSGIY